jgi:RNA polymerase sigma-32 factor
MVKDPLTRYVQEIQRHPLLTREEEHTLAVQFAKTHDPELEQRLITANLRLVVKLAHGYRRAYPNLLDLIQEGNLGLLQAVQKYDPNRGIRLASYAAWWIRAYMLKFILNNWRLVKIGTTLAQRKIFLSLGRARRKLEAEGITVTNELLAERLKVSEREMTDMQNRLSINEMSLDAPVGESGCAQIDTMESDNEPPDVSLLNKERFIDLHNKLKEFSDTIKDGCERTLFHNRLLAENPMTLKAIGAQHGFSRERARQIESRLTQRLKAHMGA